MINDKNLVNAFLELNLKPKTLEKKQFGEVFTPQTLINEMLDKLPKEVWKNSSLKWFDPAVGIGNFMIEIYYRLMEGLVEQFPDFETRKSHIISNMLYMSELNPANTKTCRRIFGDGLNIYEGDTLGLDTSKVFGVDAFDIIVGNPPYNKGGIRSPTGKKTNEKKETIWPNFIKKSFQLLKPDGYLVFINPLSWLKKNHSLHDTILEKHILWLMLWDSSMSKEKINGEIPISLYVLQNTINNKNYTTKIISEIKRKKLTTSSVEYLDKRYSIPLAYHNIFNKLIKFINENNCKLEYHNKTVDSSGEEVVLPKNYTLQDNWAVNTYRIKKKDNIDTNIGLLVKKAANLHPDANKRKIIIANKAKFTGAFIDDGRLSLTGTDKFYILGNNLELILKIINFKISNITCDYTKYRMSFLGNEVFNYIPDIRKLGITDITEDEFYNLIGLTTEEIKSIKQSVSHWR